MKTAPQTNSHSSSSSDEIDLGKLLGVLLDARWLIIVTTVAFTVIGVAYAVLATPIYRSDALVQVEEKSTGIPGLSDVSDMFSSESTAETEIQIIKSRMVIGTTVDKLNLTVTAEPKRFPLIGKRWAQLTHESSKKIDIKSLDVPDYLIDEPLTFIVEPDNRFLLEHNGKKLISGIIGKAAHKNGINIDVYSINADVGDHFVVTKAARLVTIKNLQDSLSVSEQGKKTGILRLSLEGEDIEKIQSILDTISQTYLLQNVERSSAEAEKSLIFLRKQVPQIREQLDEAETKLNHFKSQNDSVDLQLEAESVLKTMVTVESQLNELTFKESDIAQKYTKSHPAYVALLEKRETLLNEKKKLDAQVAKMPKTQQEIIRLTRDVEVNQEIYVQLVGKMQELNVMKASAVGNVRILDNAETLEEPVKPKKALVVVAFLFIGVLISTAYAMIKQAFHRGVENPDEIEALGLPVYASVPRSELQVNLDSKSNSKVKGRHKHHQTLLAKMNPADLAVEALRGLRTSLHFAMMEAKNNVVMFSGPAPGIGKSFVSSNFAVVAAQTGQKVLLVDADMRKGYLQRLFNVKAENGLSDILAGTASIENALKNSGVEGLEIITRGQVPPNPSELLMHERFKQFIDWAAKHYDLVIVDTPPILAVTDAGVIGTHAGTTLMVGRFSFNSVKEIDVARNRFNQMGIEVKGFILNAVERKASSYYGEYGYYSYAYGTDGDKQTS